MTLPAPSRTRTARSATGVAIFVAVSYALAWLALLPVWLSGGDVRQSSAEPYVMAAMFAPSAALLVSAAVTSRLRRIRALFAETGVTSFHGRPRRLVGCLALALVSPLLVALAGLLISAGAGRYRLHSPFPATALAHAAAGALPYFLVGLVLVFGEEWGWRGYLLPRLRPLGVPAAMLTSGLVWGLFHAPVTLLGYQYPGLPGPVGMALFTVTTTLIGTLIGGLRLYSGSVWPAVVAHAATNFLASQLPAVLGRPAEVATAAWDTPMGGWPAWIVLAAIIAVLAGTRRFRHARRVPTTPVTSVVPAGLRESSLVQ